MTYYFSVLNGYLECTNSRKIVISDSVNYHTAHFTIDSSLDGYSKSATFTNTKTGVSKLQPLDGDNNCVIPFEPLVGDGYLDVCIKATLNTSIPYTAMLLPLTIIQSDKTDTSTPTPPTQDVYDQILEIANDKFTTALTGNKSILTTDWQTATEIFPITTLFTPIIVTSTTVTLRTGTFDDYLDRTSYPYIDFYMDYSLDGETIIRVMATSESGASPTLRRINFTVGGNTYELRVTSSSITIRRMSGTTNYYVHQILLRFDDYFYYDYIIDGFTTKYQAWLYLEDSSRESIKGISFKRYPLTNNGYIRLNFSQRPSGILNVIHRALKTDKDLPYAIWMNTEGDVIYKDIIPEPIDDLVTTYDNYIPTVSQIKEYVNSKLV